MPAPKTMPAPTPQPPLDEAPGATARPGDRAASRVLPVHSEYVDDRQFATTLARGLELLRCFTHQRPVLGNKDLAERCGLPPSTVTRLAYTLVSLGYLAETETYGKYRLGPAVLSLGYPLLASFGVRRVAKPLMIELAEEVNGAVALGIRDRLDIVYIEVARADNRSAHTVDTGTTHPIAGTAIGRAYLAACDTHTRQSIINQIRVKAPDQWQRWGKAVQRNLQHYPQHGVCTSLGEVFPDVQAVATPLGRLREGELAVLNCAFVGVPIDEEWLLKSVGPKLLALARRLA
ncbi:MAG: IclR family transcriptional regulator [Burkholderiaceae bacterium]